MKEITLRNKHTINNRVHTAGYIQHNANSKVNKYKISTNIFMFQVTT